MRYQTRIKPRKPKRRQITNNIKKSTFFQRSDPKQPTRAELAAQNSPRARGKTKKNKVNKARREKLKKIALLLLAIFLIIGLIVGLWFFSYLQELNDELPSIDNPFQDKELASVIYDRNGKELYKLFNEFNRDPVNIDEIPDHVKWAFLAAEDIDFYTHQGFDPTAVLRCGLLFVRSGGSDGCGGSTITQQMVKITTVGAETSIERKLKELLLALKIEQAYTKDEILQIYLSVAPFGSSIYGVTTGADFYFGKAPKDLTLAEATVLASIIQNPVGLTPTLTSTPEENQERLAIRQDYVLGQIESNLNKINNQLKINHNDYEMEDVFTQEMIDEARETELKYRPPVATDIKAGHFVNYALDLLQERNYKNDEEPFTLSDLQTGGYTITTTLDYDLQQVAEKVVKTAANSYIKDVGGNNAAMLTMKPNTGQILVMVGSKDFYGEKEGCNKDGAECTFSPQVNILDTRQSPGSSTKPYGFYEAYRQGLIFPGSFLPDIPVEIGGGYTVKNYNGIYNGINTNAYAAKQLVDSRNLPAIIIVQAIGVERFVEMMQEFGYSTYDDPSQFGPSVILGGADVYGIEHANGYTAFANGGEWVRNEAILKITDREGNVVYEAKPEKKDVADPQAAYLLNQSVLNSHGVSWDGRDVSAKTGTSENNTDLWTVMWSPDFVTVGWAGNNNNKELNINAFGVSAVQPFLKDFMQQVGDTKYFNAKTPFNRPGGIITGGGCSGGCNGEVTGLVSGYMIEGRIPEPDNIRTTVRICTDQRDRIARPIDEVLKKATNGTFITWRLFDEGQQKFVDKYLKDNGQPNGPPKNECTRDRSGSGTAGPFFHTMSVDDGDTVSRTFNLQGSVYSVTGDITGVEFYIDGPGGELLGTAPGGNEFDVTLTVPAQYDDGRWNLYAVASDDNGDTGSTTVSIIVGAANTSNMTVDWVGPDSQLYGANTVTLSYSGPGNLSGGSVHLFVNKNGGGFVDAGTMSGGGGNYTYNLTSYISNPGGGNSDTYTFYATGSKYSTGSLSSPVSGTLTINGI